ncbi:Dihydrolipoyllysine-residue acetyltransferase component of pyruvate dehydrogenase complex, partial [Mycoplasmopsis edwardii]
MEKIISTPLARALAAKLGIDITQVKGTGPQGRILKDDVANFSKAPTSAPQTTPVASTEAPKAVAPVASLDGKREKITPIRKTIAKAMVNSRDSVAYFSLVNEINVSRLW